ncbi:hypothetical protein Tco_0158411 [Tanacetum coccineum]
MTTAQTTDISNDSRLKRPNSMWSQTIFKYDKFGPLGNPRIWAKSKDISMQFATLRESLGQRRDDDDSLQYKEGDFHRLRSKTLKICCLSSLYKESDKKSSVEELNKGVRLRFSDRHDPALTGGSTQDGDEHGVMWLMASVALAGVMDPVTLFNNPPPTTQSQKDFVSKITEIHSFLLTFSLRNIRVNSFTMKMEILLESTSNKLMVEHAEYDESNTYVLERFNTSAGNPVKKILLKLNLSDHRLCKMVVECQSVKVKEFQERCNIKAFQEWYEHVGPEVASPQGGKVTRWRRDCAWLMISKMLKITMSNTSSRNKLNPRSQ